MNGLTKAYLGDAYYELKIRTYLTNQKKITHVNKLHQEAIKFTSGLNQSRIITYLIDQKMVSDDEIELFKTGRNSSGPGRKNIDAKDYHYATGFESLIGHLYLYNQTRADELIDIAIAYIEKGDF